MGEKTQMQRLTMISGRAATSKYTKLAAGR